MDGIRGGIGGSARSVVRPVRCFGPFGTSARWYWARRYFGLFAASASDPSAARCLDVRSGLLRGDGMAMLMRAELAGPGLQGWRGLEKSRVSGNRITTAGVPKVMTL